MYLGIDLGTSEVKALVIDENHEVIASHSAPLSIQRPHPHWSEQAPELWWEATEYLMSTLREKCAQHWPAIKAIGLSGQMHGAVLLDAEGQAIRPAILWNDTRCAAECAELEAMAPELHQVAGNRDAGLYRAETVVGAPSRAAALSAHRHGAVAEGLSALSDDREESLRYVGRRRDAVAGRGEARLVRRSAGQVRPVA